MKSLEEKILKMNFDKKGVKRLETPSYVTAHDANLRGVWYFNILTKKLDYSDAAKTHQDRDAFKEYFSSDSKGWVRGRVFEDGEKYYIFAYLEDWIDWPVTRNTISSIYAQVQKPCGYAISDVLDAYGYSLTENKKG